MTETARKICRRLHAYLRMDRYAGHVHDVYNDAIHLETAIGMVTILSNAHCLHPFAVMVNSTKPFPRYDILEGQEVLMGDERIEIPACGFSVDLSQATDIELSVESMRSLFMPVDLDIRLRHILRVLEANETVDALSPLVTETKPNPYCDEVRPLLDRLHTAFREQEPDECREAASAIAGIGNAAASSSDDLLCGYAAGYAALSAALGRSWQRVLSLTRELAQGASAHTDELNGAFLLQAGEGMVSEDIYQLLRCVFSDAAYSTMVAYATKMASSGVVGVNLLTGIYLAIFRQYGGQRL